jgi:hypothetical protein
MPTTHNQQLLAEYHTASANHGWVVAPASLRGGVLQATAHVRIA